MPTPRSRRPSPRIRSSSVATRSVYARTPNSFLVNDPDGFPSDFAPVWWYGLDSGGGSYPIGPNGPFATSGPALPVVTRATSLITGPLTAAPFREVDVADGHPLGRARWLTDPMLVRDDERYTADVYPAVTKLPRGAFWTGWIRSAIWWGWGAFICQEDETGQPLAGTLRLVDPFMLSTQRDESGVLVWVLGAESSDHPAVFSRDGFLELGPVSYRIVVLRNPHSPVDAEGRSQGVFEMSPTAFQLSGQIDRYSSGTFRSGIPAGYLSIQSPNPSQDTVDDLKASWLRNHGGDRRSIAVLSSTVTFTPLNLSPVDAALGEAKRLNIGDVAFAFALDPLTLGVSLGNSAAYTNLRDAWTNHKDFGLAPWIAGVEDALTALLPGTQGVKVNLDGFANPPLKERVETGAAAVDAGLMTVDEWRALEGLPPMPEQPKPELPPEFVAQQALPPPPPKPELEAAPEIPEQQQRHLQIRPWRR